MPSSKSQFRFGGFEILGEKKEDEKMDEGILFENYRTV